jgi:3-hydroxyacyl-CoA dehydrogenase/3-hydroxy-2-methylbutyryl-CoA dehydrogenase
MALAGRIALVTGGASGLGKATVQRFVKAGAKVAIMDLPSQPGAELAKQLGSAAMFLPADVTSEAEAGSCARRCAP